MSALEIPAEIAAADLERKFTFNGPAEELVETVLEVIEEPDREMIAAGLRALSDNIARIGIEARLVEVVWAAMFDRVRR